MGVFNLVLDSATFLDIDIDSLCLLFSPDSAHCRQSAACVLISTFDEDTSSIYVKDNLMKEHRYLDNLATIHFYLAVVLVVAPDSCLALHFMTFGHPRLTSCTQTVIPG